MREIDQQIINLLKHERMMINELASQLDVSQQTIRNRISHLNNYQQMMIIERGLVTLIVSDMDLQMLNDDLFIRYLVVVDIVIVSKIASFLYCSEKTVYAKVKRERELLKNQKSFQNLVQLHMFIANNFEYMASYLPTYSHADLQKLTMQQKYFDYSNLTVDITNLVISLNEPATMNLEEECSLFIMRFVRYLKYSFDSIYFTEQTLEELSAHLRASYLKIKYKIGEQIIDCNRVIGKYQTMFNVFCESIQYFLKIEEMEFGNDQLIYIFVILLRDITAHKKRITNVVILCENGVATSYLLEQQLRMWFEAYKCIYIGTVDKYQIIKKQIGDDYLIISASTRIHGERVIIVDGVLDNKDISKISKYLTLKQSNHLPEYQLYTQIRRLLKPGVDYNLFKQTLWENKRKEGYMLIDLIKANMIQRQSTCQNWETAIRSCARALVKNGYVTENYVEAMIANVHKLGTYIVLVDGFALPHSKPEDGALKVGISVLVLENAVEFPDDKKVNVIMTLSTSKANDHLQALVDLANLLKNENVINDLINLKNEKEIYEYIKNF